MPKASPIQNAFNAGELSPHLRGRADLEKYGNGCSTLVNFLPQIHGPARKRPGTRFVREVKDSSTKVRLVPFEFSNTQAFALEFGHNYIRFYANGGVILNGGVPYEVATTYTSTELVTLGYAQSADAVYLAHANHPPRKLSRLSDTNWTLTEVAFDWPPFNDENTDPTTITASGVTGSIILTASAATFTASDVGAHVRLTEVVESKHNTWEPGKVIAIGEFRTYDGNLYEASSAGTTSIRPPLHKKGTESDGAVDWIYLHDGAGYVKITGYTSTTVVTATVVKRLPNSVTGGTDRWGIGAWSASKGYPRAVTFYEDRLWFAGSTGRPQTLWASVSGDYENHKYGTNDDDALNYTINSQDMNTIQWLSPGKVLSIGTSNGEFTLSATQISDAVTPTNVRIVPQTTYGNASAVRPLRVASSILFVQRAARKLREYVYNYETDSFVAPNMNVLADHISESGFADLSYQQEPYQIIWAPRNDGVLTGLTYERAEDVVGWHRHDVSGSVESVVSLPHWDGDQDVTWMVVKRTINGQTKRYVEYLEKYMVDQFAFYVDSGLTYDGTPTSTITGLSHLEGKTVTALVDGAAHPTMVVTGGAVTLQRKGSIVSVGLPYTATLVTMPLEAGAADGVAQGKTMRINNVTIRLHETGPGLWFGPHTTSMNEYHPRYTTNAMDNPVPLFTGDSPLMAWPSGYETSPQMAIEHRLPLPCTVVALMPQVHTYDR